MHAKAGGSLEVMGVMVGWIREQEFVVIDSYPLPVQVRLSEAGSAGVTLAGNGDPGDRDGGGDDVHGGVQECLGECAYFARLRQL